MSVNARDELVRSLAGLALFADLGDPALEAIADFRLAATLEFLRAIDYDFPAWAEEYMTAMETTLGDAYTEAAADVRGFVASAK